VQSDLFA